VKRTRRQLFDLFDQRFDRRSARREIAKRRLLFPSCRSSLACAPVAQFWTAGRTMVSPISTSSGRAADTAARARYHDYFAVYACQFTASFSQHAAMTGIRKNPPNQYPFNPATVGPLPTIQA
jgi:hypothetical protein